MNSKKTRTSYLSLRFLVIISLILCSSTGFAFSDDLALSQVNPNGLIVSFEPREWHIKSLSYEGQEYQVIDFLGAQYDGQVGEPRIPMRAVVIGIPQNAQVQIQVLEASYQKLTEVHLLPCPELIIEDQLTVEKYRPDLAIYNSDKAFPGEIVRLDEPGYFRDQRMVRILFYPVQFFPRQKSILRYDKIIVQVRFIGGERQTRPNLIPGEDEYLYRELIFNYEQARGWRKTPVRMLRKKSGLFTSGDWYKIRIENEGIYKLDGQTLAARGVDLSAIDPATLRMYNNGGQELPTDLYQPRPDSLIENAIQVIDGGDNRFDASDYILFYGKAVEGWKYQKESDTYRHYINHYTRSNVYWLTWGGTKPGKRMQPVSLPLEPDMEPQTKFKDRVFSEEEFHNVLKSGLEWYGKPFYKSPPDWAENKTFSFDLPSAVSEDTVWIRLRLVGVSSGRHEFDIYFNSHYLGTVAFQGYTTREKIVVAPREFSVQQPGILKQGRNDLQINYIQPATFSQAYLDWIEMEYFSRFQANNDLLFFNAPLKSGRVRYQISGFSSDQVRIFDITDFHQVKEIMSPEIKNGVVNFVDSASSNYPRRYLALTPAQYLSPTKIEKDMPSDLRNTANSADLIVITHDDFYDQVLPLKSLRENCDDLHLQTAVVKISDVFDEFSAGLFDPTAIRDFLKYAYDHWAKRPRFVLLFGDGDYDYKNILSSSDQNWIPPHQTPELDEYNTRTTDDWFTYVSGNDRNMDLAIGRIPVRTPDQARHTVEKIVSYETSPLFGDWRNTVTILGDDELVGGGTGNQLEHTQQAEQIAEEYIPDGFNLRKIYLTEYPAVRSSSISGVRKPAAQKDFLDQINRGSLIINFVGHGNEELLTHERVFTVSEDWPKVRNGMRLAFWIAATCAFGRYDDPLGESFAEKLVLAENRGAIVVLASARDAFSVPNAALNMTFYSKLFPPSGQNVRLGEALMLAKIAYPAITNDEKQHLLGDPALKLAAPQFRATITSIVPDSLKALSRIKITGQVQKQGNLWHDFQGKVLLKAFDSKKRKIYTTASGSQLHYWLPGGTIFRGTGSVQNGQFELNFIVPKDITYGGNLGRISLYFWNDEFDGHGYRDSLKVGGTDTNLVDTEGPRIHIGIKNQDFSHGDFVNPNPVLLVEIADTVSGVNIAGDIGHNITMTLDGDAANKFNLTDLFNYYENDYLRGSIEYQLFNLSEGEHFIEIKAWDNFNNSSTAATEFIVVADDRLVLQNVMNYPNPFSSGTTFTFHTNHEARVRIKIYTVAGRLIRTLEGLSTTMIGFNHYYWDGRDQDGDALANGVYLYKISLRADKNGTELSAEAVEKMIVIR